MTMCPLFVVIVLNQNLMLDHSKKNYKLQQRFSFQHHYTTELYVYTDQTHFQTHYFPTRLMAYRHVFHKQVDYTNFV